jgi:hypothetical protein
MKKQLPILEEKQCFKLPFGKGSFNLTEVTLNSNSAFRKPTYFYPIHLRKIGFHHEVLSLGVKLEGEAEQRVYLKVKKDELWVSCSFDTDQTYLSRYAYFGILKLMDFNGSVNFKKFYWPGFFDPETGKSKYLQILNDRMGMDINLKNKYPSFYKPGDSLLQLHIEQDRPRNKTKKDIRLDEVPEASQAMGYFLADTHLVSYHSNHYPFLVPFRGILTKDGQKIKSFSSFVVKESEIDPSGCTSKQKQLNEICFKMMGLAAVNNASNQNRFEPNEDEVERGKQLFELWQEAQDLILSQKHIYFCHTYGLRNLVGKPNRRFIKACEIRKETPQLQVKKVDKGDYYQLELHFKANGKMYIPASPNIAFFINPKVDWLKIYLLGSFNDYLLTSFFAKSNFKLAVLKCHYKGDFEDFVEGLAEHYEIMEA